MSEQVLLTITDNGEELEPVTTSMEGLRTIITARLSSEYARQFCVSLSNGYAFTATSQKGVTYRAEVWTPPKP